MAGCQSSAGRCGRYQDPKTNIRMKTTPTANAITIPFVPSVVILSNLQAAVNVLSAYPDGPEAQALQTEINPNSEVER
jgi:hypothetical protein